MSKLQQKKKQNADCGNRQVEQIVSLQLTLAQAEKLEEALFGYLDEGPINEGWASSELNKLRAIVESAVEKVKAAQ